MRVGVNTLGIRPGWGGGEEIYLQNALRALTLLDNGPQLTVFTDGVNHEAWSGYERVRADEVALEDVLEASGIDVLFTSYYRRPEACPVPHAIYILELWTLDHAQRRKRLFKASPLRGLEDALEKAGAAVVPSQFLKKDLLVRCQFPLDRTVVAPFGVDARFGKPQECIVEKPFILLVGNISERKNIHSFFEAFLPIAKQVRHNIVIAGRPGEAELPDWGRRVIRIDRLPVPQLAGLYQHCDLFVCCSYYEGSGVTVAEALMAGARVAAARVGGIPEVGDEFPQYFDPEDVPGMAAALKEAIIEDDIEREGRARFERQHASAFTWERCAKQLNLAFRRATERRTAARF